MLVLLMAVANGCLAEGKLTIDEGCAADNECKADRICVDGSCVDPVTGLPDDDALTSVTDSSSPATSNVIQNGGFEEIDPATGLPSGWQLNVDDFYGNLATFTADTEISHEGQTSLRVYFFGQMKWLFVDIEQQLDPTLLEHGQRYTGRFWVRHTGLDKDQAIFFYFGPMKVMSTEFPYYGFDDTGLIGPAPAQDWKEYSFDFQIPDDYDLYDLGFALYPENYSTPFTFWVDDVVIQPVP